MSLDPSGVDAARAAVPGKYAEKPPQFTTLLWQRVVLRVMVGAALYVQKLSRPAALRFGTRLGKIGCMVSRSKYRRAEANLHLAYGDALSPRERSVRAREVFEHFGRCLVDFLRAPLLSPQTLADLVTCENWEYIAEAQEKGKGVLLVTGHIGNWEILGRWLALVQNVPLTVVAKDPKNAAFAAYLRQMRENAGFAVLSKGKSARELLLVLRRGESVCLLPDQNSGDVFVPFFGVPTGTVAGPASLALHTGAPLIPIYCVADGNRFRVICLPEVPVQNAAGGEAEIARITCELNDVLEATVRQYPAQWLWLHNRWKSSFEQKNHARAWPDETDETRFADARKRWAGNKPLPASSARL